MIDLNEVHSLSDFQRRTKTHVQRLKRSGKPHVLTVNGRAEIVVQDARSYQKLLVLVEEAETVMGIRRGLESIQRGEGITLSEFDERMRRKHKIPSRA